MISLSQNSVAVFFQIGQHRIRRTVRQRIILQAVIRINIADDRPADLIIPNRPGIFQHAVCIVISCVIGKHNLLTAVRFLKRYDIRL